MFKATGGNPAKNLLVLAFLSLFGNGCALWSMGNQPVVMQCVLPSDQYKTLNGHWKTTPVPIAFQVQSNFSSGEMAAITAAADSWNNFYSQTKGFQAIDYGNAANPRTSSASLPAYLCSSATPTVVIYKRASWPYAPGAIAITHQCNSPASPLPIYYSATMELNYQNFFVAGQKQPDLQSIVLHEFGHLMGLAHSCEYSSTVSGMPDCNDPNISQDYLDASLFPVFGFDANGYGQVKQSLMSNDQGRANCLY